MNRHPATPREFDDLMAYLDGMPDNRKAAIARFMFEEVDAPRAEALAATRRGHRILADLRWASA